MNILAISGSLRRDSSNKALLRAAAQLLPVDAVVTFYDGLADLPHFNPDLDESTLPTVADWRARLAAAQGFLISSPEYAHSVPGALKNALDWVVGSIELEFSDKPLALLSASPASTYVHTALLEVLTVMGARPVEGACIALALRGRDLAANDIVRAPEFAEPLRAAMLGFANAVREYARR